MRCCRIEQTNNKSIGEWYLPTGQAVVSRAKLNDSVTDTLYRALDDQEVRLERRGSPTGPLGIYTCSVPDETGTIINASIYIINQLSVTVSSISTFVISPTVVAGKDNATLICTGNLSGPAVPTITWTGPMQNSPTSPIFAKTSFSYSFMLTPVRQSYTGTYTCTVSVGESSMSDSISLEVTAPSVSILITESQAPVQSSEYILTCDVMPPSFLDITSPSYQWRRNEVLIENQTTDELNLSPLQFTENFAKYTCQYRASSIYVNNVNVISPVHTVIFSVSRNSSDGTQTILIVGIILAIILCILMAAIVVIGVIIFNRCLQKKTKSSPPSNELITYSREYETIESVSPHKISSNASTKLEENSETCKEETYINTSLIVQDGHKPVPLDEFNSYVSQMHADRDKWFETEYTSIEKSLNLECGTAKIPKNRSRNRFNNIYPYDFNRVILSTISDVENSDYINASYVNGYRRNKVYIAAQGPMPNSVNDFWRMIWEQKCPTIVMLTKVFEGKKKCEEYWPQSTSDPFVPCSESSFVIELKSSLSYPEFVIKKMTIVKSDNPELSVHDVTLFHYLGWPDHGVPANAISVINFIRRVRKSHPYSNTDLMVVHCSAGVGRTGTFITLDYMLERIKTEKSINIFEYVSELRKQRVLMVQTLAQYVFIHNALDELLTCGDTEITAANLRIVIGRLSRPVKEGSEVSSFQKQYEILSQITCDIKSLDFSQSKSEANKDKNRYDDKIPFNYSRVILRPSAAHGSDYINASHVEGYRQNRAYIATQGPLPHTLSDFWRMIWEQNCRCIVMFCKTNENGLEVCHRYWPEDKGLSADYGKLTVTYKDENVFSDFVMRKLEITENHSTDKSVKSSGFNILQFQYLKWQEDTVPNSTSAILEIANLIQKVQISTGNKPIVVMCNDGVGRSGTFISIHAQMERMKSEGVIDVFQFIKSVRFQRAGLVTNKDQYEFCHHVLADFLDGFETYANFKEII